GRARQVLPAAVVRDAGSALTFVFPSRGTRVRPVQAFEGRMKLASIPDGAWAILFARLVLGLIFGMAGWGKVFKMGATAHAHRYFVDPYATSWIPGGLLWALGLAIPFVELAGGWLVFLGWFTRPALIALGCVLAI